MDISEVGEHFTEVERQIIRHARRVKAGERTQDEAALVRKYQRLCQRRSRAKLPRVNDLRKNPLFQEWLGLWKLTYNNKKEYQALYKQFRRELERV
jgi:hypothetical protein